MLTLSSNALLLRAKQLHGAGRLREAIDAYRMLLKVKDAPVPQTAQVECLLGAALTAQGSGAEGRSHIERAIKLAPRTAGFHRELANAYRREGKFAKAHEALRKAAALDPADPVTRAVQAELFHMEGEYAAAMRALEPVMPKATSAVPVALMFGTLALRLGRQREAIGILRQALARQDLTPVQRMKVSFNLGALHDSLDEFDQAFEAYRQGNELNPLRYDAKQHETAVTEVIERWSPELIRGLPTARAGKARSLFIVGMPRSGTTLVEQILSVSPEVLAAGELNHLPRLARAAPGASQDGFPLITDPRRLTRESIEAVARGYADALAALQPNPHRPRPVVTDKLPLNFLNLGLVQQALPEAKVIHCRRDPLDTCLSCYFHLFDGALSFAYSLEGVGNFHRQEERLMAHWKAVLGLPILDVQYEELVADQEGVSRRIWEFAELPWTDDALRFHESKRTSLTSSNAQVRQPIYTRSVQRNRNYDRWLEPLRTALGLDAAGNSAAAPR